MCLQTLTVLQNITSTAEQVLLTLIAGSTSPCIPGLSHTLKPKLRPARSLHVKAMSTEVTADLAPDRQRLIAK